MHWIPPHFGGKWKSVKWINVNVHTIHVHVSLEANLSTSCVPVSIMMENYIRDTVTHKSSSNSNCDSHKTMLHQHFSPPHLPQAFLPEVMFKSFFFFFSRCWCEFLAKDCFRTSWRMCDEQFGDPAHSYYYWKKRKNPLNSCAHLHLFNL